MYPNLAVQGSNRPGPPRTSYRVRLPPRIERRPANPSVVPGPRLEQHNDEGAEGNCATERDVQRGTEDRHRRIDRCRQAGRGLRPEDPEVCDLRRERGDL